MLTLLVEALLFVVALLITVLLEVTLFVVSLLSVMFLAVLLVDCVAFVITLFITLFDVLGLELAPVVPFVTLVPEVVLAVLISAAVVKEVVVMSAYSYPT